jgi:UDP-glucuronate decarboxylase
MARQTRAFCYVDDLVEGFVRMMVAPDDITGPMNLGNPVETSVAELANMVIDLTGSRSKIEHRPLPSTTRSSAVRISPRPRPCSAGSRKPL